jgi:DNA primase
MSGFGARVLDPGDMPKYLNSPQTQLFDKGKLLYGLDSARKHIRELDEVVIVEGYMGVIGPYQHGFRNIVAQMGTALNEYQLGILKRYTDRFIIAMDSDAAGQKATLRGLSIAREALDRTPEMVFNTRGLLRQEKRLKADIRVLTLPEGLDPDDVVSRNPEEWRSLVETAKPVVAHVMDTLASGLNLDDPKVKSAIATQVLPLIDDIPSTIERDAYLQRLSRMLEINEQALLSFRPERKKRQARRFRKDPPLAKDPGLRSRGHRSGEVYEAHCVGILLREPDLIYKVDRELGREGLARFNEKDFQNTDFQILIKLIKEALAQSEEEPRDYVLSHLPDNFLGIVDELLAGTEGLDPTADKVLEDLMRAFLNLRKWQIVKNNDHLRFLQEANHKNGDYKALEYQKNITQQLQEKHKIDKAMKRYTSRTAAFNS